MPTNFGNMRDNFDNFVIPVKLGFEEFEKEDYRKEDCTISKTLALGLMYMDVVEDFFYTMKLHREFFRLAEAYDLMIKVPQVEELRDRDYRRWPEYAQFSKREGESINHDRLWVFQGVAQHCFMEILLIRRIRDFGKSVSDLIKFIEPLYEDTPDKPFDLYDVINALDSREHDMLKKEQDESDL